MLVSGELAHGRSKKFWLRRSSGEEVECFVVNFHGELHAFVNECRHVAMTLDWVDNQFFTEDGQFLLCPTHGALYRPDSGECVAGPPCGKSLHPVGLRDDGSHVWARLALVPAA